MPTHEQLIWLITSGAVALVGVLFWDRFRRIESKTDQIERNYVKEFQSIRESIACTETKIIERIGKLDTTIAKDFVLKSDCAFIQNQHNQ
jgi:hypothetical protein